MNICLSVYLSVLSAGPLHSWFVAVTGVEVWLGRHTHPEPVRASILCANVTIFYYSVLVRAVGSMGGSFLDVKLLMLSWSS